MSCTNSSSSPALETCRDRFVKHGDKDGNPIETLLKAKQERLDNWHTLQKLAGII